MDDIFESGFSILFQETQINNGQQGDILEMALTGLPHISFKIPGVQAKNTTLFAQHVWKASTLMSKSLFELDLLGKRILELGAGSGVPSIVSGFLKSSQLVSSDYPDPLLISTLQENLQSMFTKHSSCLSPSFEWNVIGHVWGHADTRRKILESHSLSPKPFDVILLSDTLWMLDQQIPLLTDLKELLAPHGHILAVAGLHTGRVVLDSFVSTATEMGFKVTLQDIKRVPLGAGLCENQEWESLPHDIFISNEPSIRRQLLFVYKLVHAQ